MLVELESTDRLHFTRVLAVPAQSDGPLLAIHGLHDCDSRWCTAREDSDIAREGVHFFVDVDAVLEF